MVRYAVLLGVLVVTTAGCGSGGGPQQPPVGGGGTTVAKIDLAKWEKPVTEFCSACHVMPKPDRFPKGAWADEVERGFDFYEKSPYRDKLPKPPPKLYVRAFFTQQAPDELPLKEIPSTPSPIQFTQSSIKIRASDGGFNPAVANVAWKTDWQNKAKKSLYVSDMSTGIHQQVRFDGTGVTHATRHELGFPCQTSVTDLIEPGKFGYVVADLGSLLPADHDKGRVIWVDQSAASPKVHVLAKKIGRVADVQVGDFDGDGDKDLIVAVFGWQTTGKIILLRRKNKPGLPPEQAFSVETVDPRHGCIHVPVVDIDGDGDLDFVALLSQEHESIEAFINDGKGVFTNRIVFKADAPSFGSSGIQLVDMNGDKKIDVLYSNGDTYDSFDVKPYHGIQWIENQGKSWQKRHVAAMPGVHRAVAGDIDGDGDLDIVACALIPSKMLKNSGGVVLDSLIWLERTKTGFERHVLEKGTPRHATMELADFDGDGDLDLGVGYHADQDDESQTSVTIWWNQRIKKKTGS